MAKLTLLDGQTGTGNSSPFEIKMDEDLHDQARVVDIKIKSASWNSASVKVEKCHDLSESPQDWQPEQILNGTTLEDLAITANGSVALLCVLGVAYRLANTDTGSPLTVVNATAVGPIGSAS